MSEVFADPKHGKGREIASIKSEQPKTSAVSASSENNKPPMPSLEEMGCKTEDSKGKSLISYHIEIAFPKSNIGIENHEDYVH